jgi:hypothetical protein
MKPSNLFKVLRLKYKITLIFSQESTIIPQSASRVAERTEASLAERHVNKTYYKDTDINIQSLFSNKHSFGIVMN